MEKLDKINIDDLKAITGGDSPEGPAIVISRYYIVFRLIYERYQEWASKNPNASNEAKLAMFDTFTAEVRAIAYPEEVEIFDKFVAENPEEWDYIKRVLTGIA